MTIEPNEPELIDISVAKLTEKARPGRRTYWTVGKIVLWECTACGKKKPERQFYRHYGRPRSRCRQCCHVERRCCRKGLPFRLAACVLLLLLLQPLLKKVAHDRSHFEVRNMAAGLILEPLVQVNRKVNGDSHLLHDSIEYGNPVFCNRVLTGNHAI